MIERDGKTRTAVCDYCGEARPGYMSAASAKEAVLEAGWLEGQIDRRFILYCPSCAGLYAAERREPRDWDNRAWEE